MRNDDDEEFVLLEYAVSTDRSEGAGMLFPLEEEEIQPASGNLWSLYWWCWFSAEDQSTFDAQELRPCFGLLCMVASAATAAGVGFLARRRRRLLLRPR